MSSYSFLDTVVTLTASGGSASINLGAGAGVAEEGITFEYDEDKDGLTIGADGSPMHSLHASQAGTATVRLLKTSPTNQALQALFNAQRNSSTSWGQNSIAANHTVQGDKVNCQSVAFKKGTGLTYAKDAGMNEWVFNCGRMNTVLGAGN
jgi:hypothetical protein